MLRRHDRDLQRAEAEGLPDLDLEDALEATLAQEAAEPAWDDDRHLRAQLLERGQVEVVVVRVRDQDGVDATQRPGVDRHGALQVRDAVAEQRVGEQPGAVEIYGDRGMPDVLDPHLSAVIRSL